MLEKSDHELLMELIEEKRKLEKIRKIKIIIWCVILALIIAGLSVVVPKIIEMYKSYQEAMKELNQILQQAQAISEELEKVDFTQYEELFKNLNGLSQYLPGLFGR